MTIKNHFLLNKYNFNVYKLICFFLILINLIFIIHRAWYCDDSFITFRTLDNFVNGYRLTWNIYERVQAYTHPLWLFVLIPIYSITREIFLTVISVSVLLSAASLVLLYKAVENKQKLIVPLVVLAFSNAYINYSTSGLENALLNFLFSLLIFAYVKNHNSNKYIYLIMSFIALTRLDAFLVVLPLLVYIFFNDKNNFWKKTSQLIICFLPLILWELFSIFYYGFPFPNTFYAKLTAGFPIGDYLQRGIKYFFDTLNRDPISFIGLIIGFTSIFYLPKKLKPIAFGIFLYILYIFYIGGDFMPGRMYASLLFLSMALFSQIQGKSNAWIIAGLSSVFILIGFFADCPTPFLNSPRLASTKNYQIIDQRVLMIGGTSLFRYGHFNTSIERDRKVWDFGGYNWIADERAAGTLYEMPVFMSRAVGLFGYFGGPELRIIDRYGLADPLLARLPAIYDPNWRVGHLERIIPDQYPQSIADPEVKITDERLAEYNDHLKVITQGKLLSKGRLLEILRFNLGYYDYLIK